VSQAMRASASYLSIVCVVCPGHFGALSKGTRGTERKNSGNERVGGATAGRSACISVCNGAVKVVGLRRRGQKTATTISK
jgi:hypothetical protein